MEQPLKTLIVDDDEGRTLLIQEMIVIDGDETLMGRSAEEAPNFSRGSLDESRCIRPPHAGDGGSSYPAGTCHQGVL